MKILFNKPLAATIIVSDGGVMDVVGQILLL